MKLEINLDESRFKDIVDKEIEALKPEEIHDIMREAIRDYLHDPTNLKNIFYSTKTGYGYDSSNITASALLKNLARDLDLKPGIESIKNDILDFLKSDDNIQKLITKILLSMFTKNLSEIILDNAEFHSSIYQIIYQHTHHNR